MRECEPPSVRVRACAGNQELPPARPGGLPKRNKLAGLPHLGSTLQLCQRSTAAMPISLGPAAPDPQLYLQASCWSSPASPCNSSERAQTCRPAMVVAPGHLSTHPLRVSQRIAGCSWAAARGALPPAAQS